MCSDFAGQIPEFGILAGYADCLFRFGLGPLHDALIVQNSMRRYYGSAQPLYSYFSVCTGSSRAARLAGYRPASKLTAIENTIAAPMSQAGRIHTGSAGS